MFQTPTTVWDVPQETDDSVNAARTVRSRDFVRQMKLISFQGLIY